jgi:general secretion pathway protein K
MIRSNLRLHHQPINNQKGVALLTALFAVIIISYLAVEISYEAGIEYRLAKNRVDELKAHYAAKAGAEISLLRIGIYKQATAQYGDSLPDPKLLDMIWSFPFAWPPAATEESSIATKEEISAILEDTMQDTQWATQIQPEGNKMDINDLNSPVEALRKALRDKLITILTNRLNQEDEWAERNENLEVETIVNNITDWIDSDSESLNGGNESRLYQDLTPENSSVELPPNRDLKTIEELHMIAGITDDIYDVIAPQVTIYGVKGVNVNYAEKDLIRAIDLQITSEIADQIITRRQDPDLGPFKDLEDFENFIKGLGVDTNNYNESQLPLRFKKEYNFRISSTGLFGNRTKEITAIVYDFTNAKAEVTKLLEDQLKADEPGEEEAGEDDKEGEDDKGDSGGQPSKTPGKADDKKKTETYDKGRPRILYWKET